MENHDDDLLVEPDALAIKIRQQYENQQKHRARALKAETIFIKWHDKIFFWFKEKK